MTTSGTYAFGPSAGELVLAAYERIGIRAPSLRAEHMVTMRREVNFLQSSWSNKTPNLWTIVRTQTTLVEGTATYDIDPKFVMVLDASIVLNFGTTNESRRYITPISRTEYLSFSNQQTSGPPNVYWFDRLISPTITLWPVPDDGGPYTLDWFGCTQQQDMTLTSGVTPDVPFRGLDAMVADMAHRAARIYAPQLEAMRKADAMEAWDIFAKQDTENVPLTLAPQLRGYYNV